MSAFKDSKGGQMGSQRGMMAAQVPTASWEARVRLEPLTSDSWFALREGAGGGAPLSYVTSPQTKRVAALSSQSQGARHLPEGVVPLDGRRVPGCAVGCKRLRLVGKVKGQRATVLPSFGIPEGF